MTLFETGIRPAIDQHLLDEAAKIRDYGDYWSASSAGYCMRRNIFQRIGLPETGEPDARKQRVFSSGHIFHEWIQGLTKEAGISIAQEVELQDEDLMVRGHFDDLVLLDGKLILYDYKTVNSRSFTWAKKNGSGMSYYHKMQLGTYMLMLRGSMKKFMLGYSLDEARILKISKDDLRMDEQQLIWDNRLESAVIGYWKALNEAYAEYQHRGVLPDCTCADHENGFLAREAYNPFFYLEEPCSIKWHDKWKEAK